MRLCLTLAIGLTLFAGRSFGEPPAQPAKLSPQNVEFFEQKVRPLLADHCYSCHGPKKQNAGLRLDTAAGLRQGADDGPVVAPANPQKSRLSVAVHRSGDFPMPPKAPLNDESVKVLDEWLRIGAPFPEEMAKSKAGSARDHWAFQPVRMPVVPAVNNPRGTIHNDIDRFVLAKLPADISAAPQADRRTLIRRAYIDLIGLPPSAAEVEAFEIDQSPDAYEKVWDPLESTCRHASLSIL